MTFLQGAADRAAHRLASVGQRAAGLHEMAGVGAVLVPALDDAGVATTQLLTEAEGRARYVTEPPRRLGSRECFAAAYVTEPLSLRPSRVVRIRDARLVGTEAVLVDAGTGRVYVDALAGPSRLRRIRPLLGVRLLERPRRLPGASCVLVGYRSENYFHFVTDILTRLFAFADRGDAGLARLRQNTDSTTFVLARDGPAFQREYLDLLGLRHGSHPFRARSNVVVEELVFPTYLGVERHEFGGAALPAPVLRWLGDVCREAVQARGGARRLYVTRRRAPWRRVLDEQAVEAVLAAHGFETVESECLSVREQVAAFAEAEIVVAPHGAGLTNMLFARNCSVVELVSPAYESPCYYLMANALSHRYSYLCGSVEAGRQAALADFRVDLDALAATVEDALSVKRASVGLRTDSAERQER